MPWQLEFVTASCRAPGISRTWIMFRHILPNSITPLIVLVDALSRHPMPPPACD